MSALRRLAELGLVVSDHRDDDLALGSAAFDVGKGRHIDAPVERRSRATTVATRSKGYLTQS
jgi:hypothetical protein